MWRIDSMIDHIIVQKKNDIIFNLNLTFQIYKFNYTLFYFQIKNAN